MDKKYLLVTLEYPPFAGGVANYYENIVKHWPEKISVLNNNEGKLINNNLPFLKWLPAIFELRKKIKQEKINYIIVGNILPLGTAVYFLSKIFKLKYAVILHGTDMAYALKKDRKKKISMKILQKADKIICNSSFGVDFMEKSFGSNLSAKTIAVNPGVNLEIKINEELKNKLIEKYELKDKFVLLSISRLIKRKGSDKIIQAMPEVLKEIPNLEYFIAGAGPDKKYLEEIKNSFLATRNKIHFLDQVSEEEKWAWLSICDLFVLPTRTEDGNMEGFGIVYLEANLVGKAVLAGKSGGVSEAVEDKITGVLVDPKNVIEIADSIIELIENNDLRQKLGEQGKERVIKNFVWKNQVEKIYKHINTAK